MIDAARPCIITHLWESNWELYTSITHCLCLRVTKTLSLEITFRERHDFISISSVFGQLDCLILVITFIVYFEIWSCSSFKLTAEISSCRPDNHQQQLPPEFIYPGTLKRSEGIALWNLTTQELWHDIVKKRNDRHRFSKKSSKQLKFFPFWGQQEVTILIIPNLKSNFSVAS